MYAQKVLQVYLDSSDYSVLSDSSRNTEEISSIRERLASFVLSGRVRFWYSGAHIIEMSPLESRHSVHAELRTDLLVSFCGKNALLSFDRMIEEEIESLSLRVEDRFSPYSYEGDWFPEIDDSFFKISKSLYSDAFEEAIKEKPLSRDLRRKVARSTFKKGRLSNSAKNTLVNGEDEYLAELIKRYPMRKQDALVFSRYIRGDETKERAKDAFLASLRDPSWMIRWYNENSEKMSSIIQWLRGPGESFLGSLQRLSEDMRNLRDKGAMTPQMGEQEHEKLKVHMLTNLCKKLFPEKLDSDVVYTKSDFLRYTPGLYTLCATSVDVIMASARKNSRMPKVSDFADLVHSMYAPYVDIFRSDGFMAPLIDGHVKHLNTQVVGKLKDLVAVIERSLK